MSDKNLNQNDLDDLNDDLDVPTYDSASGTSSEAHKTEQLDRRDIYRTAGRSAPQTIEPAKGDDGKSHGGFGRPRVGFGRKKANETEAMTRPKDLQKDQQTENLRSLDEQDHVSGKYDDSQDFATPGSKATGTGTTGARVGAGTGAGVGAGAGAAGLGATRLSGDHDYAPDHDSDLERNGTRDTELAHDRDADGRATRGSRDARTAEVEHRRGTINFGLLIARVVVGVLLLVDAIAVLFKLGGNPGVTGLEGEFGSYYYANVLAWGIPSIELVVGVLLIFGLATPIAACIGMVAAMFMALHSFNQMDSVNFFALTADVKYWLAMSGFLVALQFTGPGLYGLDFGRGWARRPLASSWIMAIVGFAAAAGLWYFTGRTNPFN